jgi:hypothetical protein
MGRNPLKKFLYTYTSHLMVSSSLTFEGPRFKALHLIVRLLRHPADKPTAGTGRLPPEDPIEHKREK